MNTYVGLQNNLPVIHSESTQEAILWILIQIHMYTSMMIWSNPPSRDSLGMSCSSKCFCFA
jgi:hypothetical protein